MKRLDHANIVGSKSESLDICKINVLLCFVYVSFQSKVTTKQMLFCMLELRAKNYVSSLLSEKLQFQMKMF